MRSFILFVALVLYSTSHGFKRKGITSSNLLLHFEKDKFLWNNRGLEQIRKAVTKEQNTRIAKNIILFIGDGMGVSTVTAARILGGQKYMRPGEENVLKFEQFEDVALMKTYVLDRMTADSAASATALLCGVKTNYRILGMDGHAVYGNCAESERKSQKLDSILNWAQAAGKRTGIVTTARITHATPAGAYAKTPCRKWEGDSEMSEHDSPCKDIARQLIEDNKNINVLLGGGRQYFLPKSVVDPEINKTDKDQRRDGRHLINEWLVDKVDQNVSHQYVWNRDQFMTVNGSNVDYLLGLFDPSHMDYDVDRVEYGPYGEPSLAEMVEKAIDVLRNGNNGFFLLVEGARIDHGHHGNKPERALYDVLALEKAVNAAISKTHFQETLMLVTADHSHVFDIAGYPNRGANILGLNEGPEGTFLASDDMPYTILQYSNGPGYSEPRENLTGIDMSRGAQRFPSGIPLSTETHGAEDVAAYAKGPMSHLVYGVQEQTYLTYVMAYASCIGPYARGQMNKDCLSGRKV